MQSKLDMLQIIQELQTLVNTNLEMPIVELEKLVANNLVQLFNQINPEYNCTVEEFLQALNAIE